MNKDTPPFPDRAAISKWMCFMTQKNGDAPIYIPSREILEGLITADTKLLNKTIQDIREGIPVINEHRRTHGARPRAWMTPVKFVVDPDVDPVNPYVQQQVFISV